MKLQLYWPGDEREKVSNNFTAGEFFPKRHKYGPVFIDEILIDELQRLRKLIKKSIKITSGYRPAAYNKRIGGSSKSKHMLGMGADIWANMPMADLASAAYKAGFRRIGISKGFIHVDVFSGEAYWEYYKRYGRKKMRIIEKPKRWKA